MTLQGEGPLRGEPAFFVRLSKCNLACSFCDTYFDSGTNFSIEELAGEINSEIYKFFKGNVPNWANNIDPEGFPKRRKMALVITGGEPTLQPMLRKLLIWGEENFIKTQIESNGILYPEVPLSTIVVISPKCGEVDGRPTRYRQPHSETLDRANCLKFVMNDTELSPYSSIPDWAHQWAEKTGRPVFVSPMNIYRQEPKRAKELRSLTDNASIAQRSDYDEVISFWEEGLLDMEANRRNHEYAARYAIYHGFIFNVQIHLLASVA